jgi:subtilase family serine protease
VRRHPGAAAAAAAVAPCLVAFALLGLGPQPTLGTEATVELPLVYLRAPAPRDRVHPAATGGTGIVYTPLDIQQGYGYGEEIPTRGGAGKTVAVVDAYGDPTLSADVATFDAAFGLPPATVQVVPVDGGPNGTNLDWAVETALDAEWAHASAPAAQVDVFVVPTGSYQDLLDGLAAAVRTPGVAAISLSWGAPEADFAANDCVLGRRTESCLDAYEAVLQQAARQGVVVFAASGDQGAFDGTQPATLTVDYPASSPEVVGVGGTTLTLLCEAACTYEQETAWEGSGGGYSQLFSEPAFQQAAGIPEPSQPAMRGVPDVAFDADPATGVYVEAEGTWYGVGGTSVGAPNWAAISADAVSPLSAEALYGLYGVGGQGAAYAETFHDIVGGSNGGYQAGPGWDPVTGLGSPQVAHLASAA